MLVGLLDSEKENQLELANLKNINLLLGYMLPKLFKHIHRVLYLN